MLIQDANTILLVVDLQTRLMPVLSGAETVARQAIALIDTAADLAVPVLVSEHCVDKLGGSLPAVRTAAEAAGATFVHKTHFSCTNEPGFADTLYALGRRQVVVVGAEAHVCVMQSALGLLAAGYAVFVVADGVASRDEANKALALQRLQAAGATIVGSEMVMFEWLTHAGHPAFRRVLPRIKGPA